MSATNRVTPRIKNDSYPTPEWLTEAIIPVLQKRLGENFNSASVLEPACGAGQMLRVLKKHWPNAVGTDLVGSPPVDFTTAPAEPKYDLIITNPPYLYAEQFVRRAMEWRRNENSIVAMMLRINFLGSKKRARWLRECLPAIYVTPKRPKFSVNKDGKLGSDATEYAWFLWQAPFKKTSEIGILHTEDI